MTGRGLGVVSGLHQSVWAFIFSYIKELGICADSLHLVDTEENRSVMEGQTKNLAQRYVKKD